MSHTVTMKTQFKNEAALADACRTLGLAAPEKRQGVRLHASSHDGMCVQLKGWHYPVIIDTKTGEAFFDNYHGHWGADERLDELKKEYALAVVMRTMPGHHSVERLPSGAIKVTIVQAGGVR